MLGATPAKLKALPALLTKVRWLKTSMKKFGGRFSDPFLKQAFPLLVYSMPDVPLFIHLVRHAYAANGALQWPVGGALRFALSIENRYKTLGGEVTYNSRVERILVENGRAVGVRLADGTEHRANVVISNADGRKTIMDMLEGKFIDEKVRKECEEPPDETFWSVHVFLGVRRDLAAEPSAMIMLLGQPVTIAGHACDTWRCRFTASTGQWPRRARGSSRSSSSQNTPIGRRSRRSGGDTKRKKPESRSR